MYLNVCGCHLSYFYHHINISVARRTDIIILIASNKFIKLKV